MNKETKKILLGLSYLLGGGSLVAGLIVAVTGDVATGLIFVAVGVPQLAFIPFLRTSPKQAAAS